MMIEELIYEKISDAILNEVIEFGSESRGGSATQFSKGRSAGMRKAIKIVREVLLSNGTN